MAVVKTSCLDVLYKDLPVVIVNEWSDVNMDLLTAASADFANTQYDYRFNRQTLDRTDLLALILWYIKLLFASQ
jgi:hypothetical protein